MLGTSSLHLRPLRRSATRCSPQCSSRQRPRTGWACVHTATRSGALHRTGREPWAPRGRATPQGRQWRQMLLVLLQAPGFLAALAAASRTGGSRTRSHTGPLAMDLGMGPRRRRPLDRLDASAVPHADRPPRGPAQPARARWGPPPQPPAAAPGLWGPRPPAVSGSAAACGHALSVRRNAGTGGDGVSLDRACAPCMHAQKAASWCTATMVCACL